MIDEVETYVHVDSRDRWVGLLRFGVSVISFSRCLGERYLSRYERFGTGGYATRLSTVRLG